MSMKRLSSRNELSLTCWKHLDFIMDFGSGGIQDSTDPVVLENDDGRLQMFVVGTNNQLYYKTQTSPGSSTPSWISISGGLRDVTDPAVIANRDGRLQICLVCHRY